MDNDLAPAGGAPSQLTRRTLLVATSGATLAAILAGRPDLAAAASAGAAAASAGATALISLTATASGRFNRVRAIDDDTRLYLAYPQGKAKGKITGQQVTAPAHYGLDFSAYPSGQHATQYLQDLFDNTPLGYLGFYFKTTGHPAKTGDWTGKAASLLEQGWNLIPIYVGRQQYWPFQGDNQISSHTATATTQGKTDGKNAVTLATKEKLPQHSRLYLDLEPTAYASGPQKGQDGPPTAGTIAYIKAWLAAVNASGTYSAALYDANSSWTQSGKKHYGAVDIKHDLGSAAPVTWVLWDPGKAPTGVKTGKWPLDPNGDVAAVAIKVYSSNPQWGFASFAQSWQYKLDWIPAAAATFHTDTGAARQYKALAPKTNLDASKSDDPGNTAPGKPKSERRPAVSSVSADATTVKPGQSVKVTVKLGRAAAAPNGAVVLLRSSSPRLILPTSARVAAKADSVIISATAAPGSPATSVTVRARTLYQLSDAPPHTTIKIAS